MSSCWGAQVTDPFVVQTGGDRTGANQRRVVDIPTDVSTQTDAESTHPIALLTGHELQEYTIESVLGTGGFGITYLAHDQHLQRKVAVKEYLPGEWATRGSASRVVPRSRAHRDDYQQGLARFLAEARVLASFRHQNIVRVNRFFEANGTAYMVMDYEQGQSLREWAKTHGAADETQLRHMFAGLLDGLEKVHAAGMVHRDIKPGNIYVRDSDSSLVLLDFGAARYASAAEAVTSMLSPGFAPFEQYHSRGQQGPWSDLYGLGAVLYWLVTGHKPVEAPSRIHHDCQPSASEVAAGRYPDAFLQMIDWALAVNERDRPQNVAAFRPVFLGMLAPPHRVQRRVVLPQDGRDGNTVRLHEPPETEPLPATIDGAAGTGTRWRWWLGIASVVSVAIGAYLVWAAGTLPLNDTKPGGQGPVASPAPVPSKGTAVAADKAAATAQKKDPPPNAAPTPDRQFSCGDLPFALRVPCTIEGKDVIRSCAPDLKQWNHQRPGCNRQSPPPSSP
jgi:serine/threonine protein kinase